MSTVLVTGASRGIGRAITSRLAASGWDVMAGVRSDADGKTLEAESGGRVRAVTLDITDAEHVAALDSLLPARLDAVVNNAGIVVGGPIEAVPLDQLRRVLDVNVVGQVAVTQAVLPRLRACRGRTVFVSSVSGLVPSPMTGPYGASKFALEAVADALRLELRPWRMPVSLVEPAQTDTDMWRTAGDLLEAEVAGLSPAHATLYAKHLEGVRKMIPRSQKMANPAEGVAAAVERALTAARPRARYVVGRGPQAVAVAFRLLPTRVSDSLLAAGGGIPRRP